MWNHYVVDINTSDPIKPQNGQDQPVSYYPESQDLKKKLLNWFLFSPNKIMIIILAVASIVSFGSTAYMLVSPEKTKKSSSPSSVQIARTPIITPSSNASPTMKKQKNLVTLTPSPAIDPTASWSAFASTKYGYSIKYPSDWTASNAGQLETKVPEYIIFNPRNATSTAKMITLSYSTRTYEEALLIGANTKETIKVGTISGAKKIEQDSNKNQTIHVIIPLNNETKTIVFYAKIAYEQIFNQMLATLKIL